MIEIRLTLEEAELINDMIIVNAGLYDDQTQRRLNWISTYLQSRIDKERGWRNAYIK